MSATEPIIAVDKIVSRNSYIKDNEFSVVTNLVSTDGKQYDARNIEFSVTLKMRATAYVKVKFFSQNQFDFTFQA